MDITQLRLEIDNVDRQLIALFQQRMDISGQIADYKKEQNIPVFDPVRERQKLSEVASKVEPELESAVQVLYSLLFELSRSHQSTKNAKQTPLFRQITDSINVTPNLFPQQAVVACYGSENQRLQCSAARLMKSPNLLYFNSAEAVFSAVAQNMCRYGLLPQESVDIYDALRNHGFYIVRSLRVQQEDGHLVRYILFSKRLEIYPGADHTSLMMVLPNKPGSLYRVLSRLYTLGLNIAKLDSRPHPSDGFKILFYFDLETSIYSQEFIRLMCQLDDLSESFQYLGSYSEVI